MQRVPTKIMSTATVCVAVLSAFPGPAHSHHGFASHFDPSQEAALEGIVTDYEFINPHVQIHLDVAGEAGTSEKCDQVAD